MRMFPEADTCYLREYSADHLTSHPGQRVVEIALSQTTEGVAPPMLGLEVRLTLRNSAAGQQFEGTGYCEARSLNVLICQLEGDAGSFTVWPVQKGILRPVDSGSVRVEVGPDGMMFEGDAGFETIEADRGDDRSFILHPAVCH